MKEKAFFHVSNSDNVYRNLATESYLLRHSADSVTLFLWRNDNCVVIGTHQNPFAEVDTAALYEGSGKLARRITGGGAVYHDRGNLNFSFLLPTALYNVEAQLEIICKALLPFGIRAEISGRNDLTADGRKFSGNAFYKSASACLHHGTVLIDTDVQKMQRVLKPRPQKLLKHGVASVTARTINLKELCTTITAEVLQGELIRAFEAHYGGAQPLLLSTEAKAEIEKDEKHFADKSYLYGKWRDASADISATLSFGEIAVKPIINAAEKCYEGAEIASDCIDNTIIDLIKTSLTWCPFYKIPQLIEQFSTGDERHRAAAEALRLMVRE